MSRRLLTTLATLISLAALAVSACGGESPTTPTASSDPPQATEYLLPTRSELGLHQAFASFTENGELTTAVIEMSVVRAGENLSSTFPVAIHEGSCAALGEVERSLGDLPSGISTFQIEAPYDDVVGSMEMGASVIAIMAPDGREVAWCGPA